MLNFIMNPLPFGVDKRKCEHPMNFNHKARLEKHKGRFFVKLPFRSYHFVQFTHFSISKSTFFSFLQIS